MLSYGGRWASYRIAWRALLSLDAKIDEVARALGVMDYGMEGDVTGYLVNQRTKVLLVKLLLEKPDILLLDGQPTIWMLK